LERTTKKIWIVRWRGLEEAFPSVWEAEERRDQLDARGIAADVIAVEAACVR
jgi:hypothetical protein